MLRTFVASAVLASVTPLALADTPSDVAALRQELNAMRADYEARLHALEQRLNAAEAAAAAPTTTQVAPAAQTPVVADTPMPENAASTSPAMGANGFNPALSLILSGTYTQTSRDPAHYAMSGFQLPAGGGGGPGSRGFNLGESELGLAANIDPWLRGAANISLHGDDTVSVEEAYVQTTSLGDGLSVKAGRFFSGVGYLNPQHSHTWDFVDNPLAYQAFLGTQYGDDGVQLAWLLPLDTYVELGAELGRGRSFPGSATPSNGAGMAALTAHTGGDVGDSSSWRAGLSVLHAKASDQQLTMDDAGGNGVTNAFSGNTRVWVADGVWKWAPMGNAMQTNFKLQGEYLRSERRGSLVYDAQTPLAAGGFHSNQSGWYLQGIYQFIPHWRVGLRTERLDPGHTDFAGDPLLFGVSSYHPQKNTLMVDFSPSEFSRVRFQYAKDRAREHVTDDEFSVQYQMSLGAHGAHNY